MGFTAAQKVQIDRLTVAGYFKAPADSEMMDAAYSKMAKGKLEKLTPDQLRARVNITGVSWGRTPVVNYSPENDYTDAEKQAIGQGLRPGDKWAYRAADIVAGGPSIEQRVATLEGA